MLYALYAIFFISCIVLVGAVLLQPGKTDAGALFTCNVSSAAFGPRGTASVLSKITIVAAALFMVSALMISMPAFSGSVSVLQSATETPSEAPAQPTTSAEVPVAANSNVTLTSGSNTNGALVQTPATEAAANQAANGNANTALPANK